MCYRYFLVRRDLARTAEVLRARLEAESGDRYNIPPGGAVPVVRVRAGRSAGAGENRGREDRAAGPDEAAGEREVALLRWGLVPRWADDPAALGAKLANARAETVAVKPAFRDALRQRRCVVPASGFFEWETAPDGRKLPWLLRGREEAPLFFAGLWERWGGVAEPPLESCTILTTAPNALLAPFHDRMPVILSTEACGCWLDPRVREPEPLLALLRSYPAEAMTAVRVSPRVNAVAHDDPACIAPLVGEAAAPGSGDAPSPGRARSTRRSPPSGQMELGL